MNLQQGFIDRQRSFGAVEFDILELFVKKWRSNLKVRGLRVRLAFCECVICRFKQIENLSFLLSAS